jgi:hypothetical protein
VDVNSTGLPVDYRSFNGCKLSITIPANYYQQFDTDLSLDIPAKGYDGWKRQDIQISPEHTALVVMHAWDTGTPEEYPGWWRCVEYMSRARRISQEIFPPLLSAARENNFNLYHVASSAQDLNAYPGYARTLQLAPTEDSSLPSVDSDPILEELQAFKAANVFVGKHNEADVHRGFEKLDFLPEAKPLGDESIATDSQQLFALCKADGVNHLIYTGFAINWCLLLSPGGMADMSKYGIMCSAIRQAVTAVENRESAEEEWAKELGLWRVALAFGFVFDVNDFIESIQA